MLSAQQGGRFRAVRLRTPSSLSHDMRRFEPAQLDKPGFEYFVDAVLGDTFEPRNFVETEGAALDFQ